MPLDPGERAGFLLWHATLRWQCLLARALAPMAPQALSCSSDPDRAQNAPAVEGAR
jgi:hypothetical protein